ncbi:hypothetical protein C8R48DRAFT_737612 [Suillus tomentosus]|nr:hypothetical protein C8R48DRAFT_737612 [Suillus tomentosus]
MQPTHDACTSEKLSMTDDADGPPSTENASLALHHKAITGCAPLSYHQSARRISM